MSESDHGETEPPPVSDRVDSGTTRALGSGYRRAGALPAPTPETSSRSIEYATLVLALVVALFLNLWKLEWGLPGYFLPDEGALIGMGLRIGTPEQSFIYPHAYLRILSWLCDQTAPGLQFDGVWAMAPCVLPGRLAETLVSVITILVTWRIARYGLDRRYAALPSLLLAITPYRVIYAHVVSLDDPLTLCTTAVAWLSLRSMRTESRRSLLAAGCVAGIAIGVKYPGIVALAAPLFVIAHRVGHALLARRWAACLDPLVTGFGVVALAGIFFLLSTPDCITASSRCMDDVSWAISFHRDNAVNPLLSSDGPLTTKGLYQLVVILPFMLGWPLYILCGIGLARLTTGHYGARFASFLVFPVAYLASMSTATTAMPRYYLPLLPFAAILAALGLIPGQQTGWSPWRVTVAAIVLAYTFSFSASLGNNFDIANRDTIVAYLKDKSAERAARGQAPLTVATAALTSNWDGVRQLMKGEPGIRFLNLAPDLVDGVRGRPDVIVLSRPSERRLLASDEPAVNAMLEALENGSAGYRRSFDLQVPFLTRPLYTVAGGDGVISMWAHGRVSFAVFSRVTKSIPVAPRFPRTDP